MLLLPLLQLNLGWIQDIESIAYLHIQTLFKYKLMRNYLKRLE